VRCKVKFLAKLAGAMVILVLAAALAIFLLSDADAQAVASHKWVVVFDFKEKDGKFPPPPDIRLYVVTAGATEGEAAINAHKSLAERLTSDSTEKLHFLEAQRKD
jgi:hypothetical protein